MAHLGYEQVAPKLRGCAISCVNIENSRVAYVRLFRLQQYIRMTLWHKYMQIAASGQRLFTILRAQCNVGDRIGCSAGSMKLSAAPIDQRNCSDGIRIDQAIVSRQD